MAKKLFSDDLPEASDPTLSEALKQATAELRHAYPEQSIRVLEWNQQSIALSVIVPVNLPSRGNYLGLDIGSTEPLLLVLDRQLYPYKAPQVYSDRKGFPKAKLPHLNPTPPNQPASLCLHRGSIDDWFAEHTIIDLVNRARAWLSDAACGNLIRREDEFEPTRIGLPWGGYCIYDPAVMWSIIRTRQFAEPDRGGYEVLTYEWIDQAEAQTLATSGVLAVRLVPQQPTSAGSGLEFFHDISSGANGQKLIPGLLVWSPVSCVINDYFAEFPDSLAKLAEWAQSIQLPLSDAIGFYLKRVVPTSELLRPLPITLAVERPSRVMGTDSRTELIDFIIGVPIDSGNEGKGSEEMVARRGIHLSPLTRRKAVSISCLPRVSSTGKVMVLGCGALGSKLALHLARSGYTDLTLVDEDRLAPHNMVRHALLPESIGINKAEALRAEIDAMFRCDSGTSPAAMQVSALTFLTDEKCLPKDHQWILDSTASPVVMNALSESTTLGLAACCRCYLTDGGHLGVLMAEGSQRNPRLDDMLVHLFDLSIGDRDLSKWLKVNRRPSRGILDPANEEIAIGVGCSSDTMKLSDDAISVHAGVMSLAIKGLLTQAAEHRLGRLLLHRLSWDGSIMTNSAEHEVQPFRVLTPSNNASWQVRMSESSAIEIGRLSLLAHPNETGGLLIGRTDTKRRVIHITRVLPAPPDSVRSPYMFKRGIKDVSDAVRNIHQATGNLITCVGEWHSHPSGGGMLSAVDNNAVRELSETLFAAGLPVHVMIVANGAFYPYVFCKA